MKNRDPAAPKWFGLLRYYREHGHTGFTIPFLIGATRPASSMQGMDDHRDALTSLLHSFQDDTPSTHWVVIADCYNKLHVPVAGVCPPEDKREGRIGLSNRYGATRLYADREYFHGKEYSLHSLNMGLWKLVGDALMDGAYSCHDGKYAPFTVADRKLIDDAGRWWDERSS